MRTGTSGRRLAQCSTNSLTRTVDTFAGMWIIVLSCSSRGVVMGRREDGAAVRNGAEMCLRTHRVDDRGKSPPSADAAPRVGGERSLWHSGDGGAPLPGNRTRRQELADRRGWSTFSKARPVSRRTPLWSAGRRLVPKGARGRLASVPSSGLARRSSEGSHPSASAGAPLPSRERDEKATRACPGPTKEYGRSRMPADRALTKAVVSRGPGSQSLPRTRIPRCIAASFLAISAPLPVGVKRPRKAAILDVPGASAGACVFPPALKIRGFDPP